MKWKEQPKVFENIFILLQYWLNNKKKFFICYKLLLSRYEK